ncbi:hypothetical protein HQ520_01430, partial [bacterium]|nr:hypothetical protein [bacterium]
MPSSILSSRHSLHSAVLFRILLIAGILIGALTAASHANATDPWERPTYACRLPITLPAIAADRTDAPVFVCLDGYDSPISGSQCLVVDQSGPTAVDVNSTAYAQPDGAERTLFFKATGLTSGGSTRQFYIYFNEGTDFPAWTGPAAAASVYTQTHEGGSTERDYCQLDLDLLTLKRAVNATDNYLYDVNPAYTHFYNHSAPESFDPRSGFLETWSFAGISHTFDTETVPFETASEDRAGGQAALSFSLLDSTVANHRAHVTHRLFDGLPLGEYVFSIESLGSPLTADSGNKYLYWQPEAGFNRMVTDAGGDAPLPTPGEFCPTAQYGLVYNSATGDALGVCAPRPGLIRVNPLVDGTGRIYDRGPGSAKGNTVQLYYAIGRKDTILPLFQSLQAGIQAGTIETPNFTVECPTPGSCYRAGETVEVRVVGSYLDGLTVESVAPDTSSHAISLVPDGAGALVAEIPMEVTGSTTLGDWELHIDSPIKSLTVPFDIAETVLGSEEGYWARTEFSHRIRITLPAISCDRVDAPVFVDMDRYTEAISGTQYIVLDQTGGGEVEMESVTYAQPGSDAIRTLYFKAAGTSPADSERSFLIYFNPGTDIPAWTYPGSGHGNVTITDTGDKTFWTLDSNALSLQRALRKASNTIYEENPSDATLSYLLNLVDTPSFTPDCSFRETWSFTGDPTLYVGKETPVEGVSFDDRDSQLALSVSVVADTPTHHRTRITHRLFKDQILSEYVFTQQPLDAGVSLEHSEGGNHALYWRDTYPFDRMLTDKGGDAPLVTGSDYYDTDRYAIVYESGTDYAIGAVTPRRAQLRVRSMRIADNAPMSSVGSSQRMYFAVGTKDDLIALFESVRAGIQADEVEQPNYRVTMPRENDYFYDDQDIQVEVRGSYFTGLQARYIRPDQSTEAIQLTTNADGYLIAQNPHTVTPASPRGEWKIVFESPIKVTTRTITVVSVMSGADTWTFPSREYRREITLPADSASRTDAPILLDLTKIENINVNSVRVDEIVNGLPIPQDDAAYAQPSGRAPRAFWSATGQT